MKTKKFTFKKRPKNTGLSGVGYPYPDTYIKLDKKYVGYISAPNWQTKDNLWRVRFMKKKEITKADPSPFSWTSLSKVFETEQEAREFIKRNSKLIQQNINLYQQED